MNSSDGGKFLVIFNNELREVMEFKTDAEFGSTGSTKIGTIEIEPGPQHLEVKWVGEKDEGKTMRLDCIRLKNLD